MAAAVDLADREGLDGVSMRRLAQLLGVDAMSLYNHVEDKDALLAAMADAVVAQIAPQGEAGPAHPDSVAGTAGTGVTDGMDGVEPWTERLRSLVLGARQEMMRHPWAVQVLERRASASPAVLAHVERVLAVLRGGGCSLDLSHHALHLLGSRLLGFSQDLFDDASADTGSEAMAEQLRSWAGTHPHVVELALAATHDGSLGACDDSAEFDFALQIMLEGLERRRLAELPSATSAS